MKAKILLVEDSEVQANEIRNLLMRLGYDVVWANGGISALKMAEQERPDIVLLDIVMPDMDGYAVCRWLRLNNTTKTTPIIMLTVKGEVESRVEGLETGATDYLPKPFNERELEARVYAALRTKSLQQELLEKNQELQNLLQKVGVMAITDPLTGLYNKRRFYDSLNKEFATSKRYQVALSCMLIDVDHFKNINDTYGHLTGDNILKGVADRISNTFREVDIICRFGGEEFAVLLPHTYKKDAIIVAERLTKVIKDKPFIADSKEICLTVSIGVSSNEDAIKGGAEDMISFADIALYRAKANGRDRVEVYKKTG